MCFFFFFFFDALPQSTYFFSVSFPINLVNADRVTIITSFFLILDLYISQRGVLATSNTKSFQKGERPAILSGIYLSEAQESIADELKFRLG